MLLTGIVDRFLSLGLITMNSHEMSYSLAKD